ncbi:MAG TPA: hypothetical protein VF064_15475 [Pyrinomonadaceae bacterium]
MRTGTMLYGLALCAGLLLSLHPARARGGPIDAALAAQYFREARAACERDGGRLWGVSPCGPVLFVEPQTRAVVANQPDAEGQLAKQGDVLVGKLPARQPIANAAVDWAGVKWAMIVWSFLTKDEFQRVKMMAHESFHRVQHELKFPVAGGGNDHLDTEQGRVWLQLEWRALRQALTSEGKARRVAVEDALAFRQRRRALFPQSDASERALEMHEGLAEYTGFKLSAKSERELIDHLARHVEQCAGRPTFVGYFAYCNGPAYGVLLDAAGADWRKGLTPQDDLGELLRRASKIELPADLKAAADRQAARYDDAALRAAEAEREVARQKRLAAYRARLVDGPTLLVELTVQRRVAINTSNLVPLEGVGTVYPTATVTDAWGTLEVSDGALMIHGPGGRITKVYLSRPADPAARPLKGEGWTLQLNPGWTLAPGPRDGDHVLKKEVGSRR